MIVVAVVIHVIAICVLLALVGGFIQDYRGAVGSVWRRLLTAGKQSATILWARLVVIGTLFVDSLVYIADLLGAPGVSAAIQQYLSPQVVSVLMIAVAVISEIARRRTLNS